MKIFALTACDKRSVAHSSHILEEVNVLFVILDVSEGLTMGLYPELSWQAFCDLFLFNRYSSNP